MQRRARPTQGPLGPRCRGTLGPPGRTPARGAFWEEGEISGRGILGVGEAAGIFIGWARDKTGKMLKIGEGVDADTCKVEILLVHDRSRECLVGPLLLAVEFVLKKRWKNYYFLS